MSTATSVLNLNVLVLNKHYMALRVISARRAFALLLKNLAQVINIEDGKYQAYDFESWQQISQLKKEFEPEEHIWVRTVKCDIVVPKIIRLIFYDKLPRQEVKFNRKNIFARDRNRCQYCGRRFPTSELTLDHVIPRSRGGKATWENIVCCCIECNIKKGGKTPQEAGMKLISKPEKPRRSPLLTLKLTNQHYASWKEFIDHAYWNVELKE